MRIVVSAQGEDLQAPLSQVFGRCPTYLFVDSETNDYEATPNPAIGQGGGAGVQAAQYVISKGAQAVLTANLGPNACEVLKAANVPSYFAGEGTVQEALEAFKAGRLRRIDGATTSAHAGMTTNAHPTREARIAELHDTLKDLRKKLAHTMDQIEQLEKES